LGQFAIYLLVELFRICMKEAVAILIIIILQLTCGAHPHPPDLSVEGYPDSAAV
jgi:hypothetical protein